MCIGMRFGMRWAVSGALVATLFSLAAVSSAQVKESKSDDGYKYQFDDDPLSAGGFGADDALIKIRPIAARSTLIRPRVTFVPEMLKSIEHL
jgi:hypothetical protein